MDVLSHQCIAEKRPEQRGELAMQSATNANNIAVKQVPQPVNNLAVSPVIQEIQWHTFFRYRLIKLPLRRLS